MISAEGIELYIDGRRVLGPTGLRAPSGNITVVVGPNGSGKSSLARCMSLLDSPDRGTVQVGDNKWVFPDKDSSNPTPPWPRLTMMFQAVHLWPHLTLEENILLPMRRLGNGDGQRRLMELAEHFHLAQILGRRPNQVSGGEKQRAGLLRSLILQPDFFILDEPTSASDVEHARRLADYLIALKQQGVTIVLITHMIGLARLVADQVVFMEDGTVQATGGRELLDEPSHPRLAEFLTVY